MSSPRPDRLRFTQFAVDHFSDAAYLIQEDGRIVYANLAASRLLGYTEDELLSMYMFDVNRDLTRESWPLVWRALKAQHKRIFEARHVTKDGRNIAVEISANLMSFDGVEYSCAFARDIEERRALEVRLRQAEKMEAVGVLAGGLHTISTTSWRGSWATPTSCAARRVIQTSSRSRRTSSAR